MQALIEWLFGQKTYTRVGFTVWNSSNPKYQYGVAGSQVFCNATKGEIRSILEKRYGGKLDVFLITNTW